MEGAYLLHFSAPYRHARHYLGWSGDVVGRIKAHQEGNGARLMQVIRERGITFVVARLWPGPRSIEQKLKRRHSGVRLCPICKAGGVR